MAAHNCFGLSGFLIFMTFVGGSLFKIVPSTVLMYYDVPTHKEARHPLRRECFRQAWLTESVVTSRQHIR